MDLGVGRGGIISDTFEYFSFSFFFLNLTSSSIVGVGVLAKTLFGAGDTTSVCCCEDAGFEDLI